MSMTPTEERISEIIAEHIALEGPMLPILHAIQTEYGHVPQMAVTLIAAALNIGRAEVHGTMSFYHDFRTTPAGKHVVKLCRAEACQAQGADRTADHAREALGVDWHETTKNGNVTLEPVFCLGLCACGPAAMVDGKVVGLVTKKRFDRIISEIDA